MKNPYRLEDPGIRKTKKQIEREVLQEVSFEEYLSAKGELEELEEKYGLAPEEGKLSKAISTFFDRREAKEKVKVNKKKDLLLCIFLGWAGAHRFYQKQYLLGFLYLAFCWSGYSMAMSIIDLLIIFPKQADENGDILI
ncbi:MAG: TM2 domain-containing protein [Oscillospiraceae bacterium]|nr:TM2 domain-containing protein [Oscillospiraceae bacterium]MBQ7129621.1 TM2 domain-containing protein [Oscillospiraceae bacterium]